MGTSIILHMNPFSKAEQAWSSITNSERNGKLPTHSPDNTLTSMKSKPYSHKRVLFLSDLHIPFYDIGVLEKIIVFIDNQDIPFSRIVLNGDITDAYDLSRFLKSPEREGQLQSEFDTAKAVFENLRSVHSGIIDFIPGNHELRLEKYLCSDAKALQSLKCLELSNLLHLKDFDIRSHPSSGFSLPGCNFHVYHGSKVSQHSGRTAQSELTRFGKSGISGHTHRLGAYYISYPQAELSWYEQGCLCITDPEYVTGPVNWQQGFAIGEFNERTGWFNIELVQIKDGKLRYRGEEY